MTKIEQAIAVLEQFKPKGEGSGVENAFNVMRAIAILRESKPATEDRAYAEFAASDSAVNDPWGWFNTGFRAAERHHGIRK